MQRSQTYLERKKHEESKAGATLVGWRWGRAEAQPGAGTEKETRLKGNWEGQGELDLLTTVLA